MKIFLKKYYNDETAATAIEYALIATGIAVAIAVTVNLIGATLVSEYFDKISEAFTTSSQ